MRKLLLLFTGLLASISPSVAQAVVDCNSEAVQDSLFKVYSKKARKYGWEQPGWGLTYDSLLAICPNIAEAYQEKGLPYVATGNYKVAFEYNDKAVALDPQRWTAYRGYLHCIYAHNYEKAIADFETAEKLTPNAFVQDHTFNFYLGLCYMEMGLYEQSEAYFIKDIAQQKRGEAKNDIHFNSLLYFGILYYLMNEFDRAEKHFRDCLQLYEQYPMANFYLAMTMKATGNKQSGKYFEKAKQYMLEGYRMNEPNSLHVSYPRQITMADLEKR